jgi:hypothetical protein
VRWCAQNKVLACAFQDNNTLVTCGADHIYFWDIPSKTKKKGLFGRAVGVKLQSLLALAPLDRGVQIASGTATGHIYAWQGRNCIKAVKAHEAMTAALFSCSAGLVSGGKDGKVKLWSFALEPRGSFDIAVFGSLVPSVRSVCWDPPRKRLLVGTLGCEVYEFSSDDGTNLHHGPLVQGHCKWELWGLAVSAAPTTPPWRDVMPCCVQLSCKLPRNVADVTRCNRVCVCVDRCTLTAPSTPPSATTARCASGT